MRNKILLIIAVSMLPIAVISFSWSKSSETNFNLPEKPKSENITVNVLIDGEIQTLDLEEYIVGVVAGEMPASFNEEALKAQAVASRSYALYKKKNSDGHYDLTDDTNSQVYIDIEDMKLKWGNEFDKYYIKIKNCVDATNGLVATYKDEIIEAFYFSMSSGQTQDVVAVFGENFEYLKSVESEYDNENLNNYKVTKSFSNAEFKNYLNLRCESITVDYIVRNDSGYIDEISICSTKFKGTDVRSKLSLRSANFDIFIGKNIEITTYGYGHGVGMSQYGANGYANAGYTYEEILKHYYSNIEIINIKSV